MKCEVDAGDAKLESARRNFQSSTGECASISFVERVNWHEDNGL